MLYILKDTDWLPRAISFKPDAQLEVDYQTDWPCQKQLWGLNEFYLFKLAAISFEMGYCLVMSRHRHDVSEMVLHHCCTLGLIGFSFAVDYKIMGVVIMLVHDGADIFVHLFKGFYQVNNFCTMMLFYTLMLGSWIYLRLYTFPRYVLMTYYKRFSSNLMTHPV